MKGVKSKICDRSITGFIDILGFGGKVLAIKDADEKKIEELVNAVKAVRKNFDHIDGETTDDEGKLMVEYQNIASITTLAFSDSVIFNMPLKPEIPRDEEFGEIMNQVTSLAYAQAECIFDGFFIRGGVDLGWWYKENDLLVSQSLARAYLAESKANYPIIVITDSFNEYFENHLDLRLYGDTNIYSSNFEYVEILQKDGTTEKYLMLDYIRIVLESLTGVTLEVQENKRKATSGEEKDKIMENARKIAIKQWLIAHAKKIQEAFNNATQQDVKDKYVWLSNYHNRKVEQFMAGDECLCNLC